MNVGGISNAIHHENDIVRLTEFLKDEYSKRTTTSFDEFGKPMNFRLLAQLALKYNQNKMKRGNQNPHNSVLANITIMEMVKQDMIVLQVNLNPQPIF